MKKLLDFKEWNNVETALVLLVVLIIAVVPLFVQSTFYLNMVVMAVVVAYISMSWNILGGYCGQLFLGGGVIFFGIGAYTSTVLLVKYGISPWIGMLIGSVIAMIFGWIIAKLTLRYALKGDYLALFSVALSQIMGMIMINVSYLGGSYGFNLPLGRDSLAMMTWTSKVPYLYISLGMLLMIAFVTRYFQGRKLGKYWMAIRENENAAETLGVNTAHYKTMAMLATAGLGAMGGTIYAQYTTFIEPHLIFGLTQNFEMIIPVLVGGKGTILGPILGAMILKPMSELIRMFFGASLPGLYMLIYGVVLIVVIIYLPAGIVGALKKNHFKRMGRDVGSIEVKGGETE